jgi:hypothetical protein
MKNAKKKELKANLFEAIKKVLLKDNTDALTSRSEKAMRKSIKRIVKKTDKRKKGAKQTNKSVLNAHKIKMDGVMA